MSSILNKDKVDDFFHKAMVNEQALVAIKDDRPIVGLENLGWENPTTGEACLIEYDDAIKEGKV